MVPALGSRQEESRCFVGSCSPEVLQVLGRCCHWTVLEMGRLGRPTPCGGLAALGVSTLPIGEHLAPAQLGERLQGYGAGLLCSCRSASTSGTLRVWRVVWGSSQGLRLKAQRTWKSMLYSYPSHC